MGALTPVPQNTPESTEEFPAPPPSPPGPRSRGRKFLASPYWVILRNIIGWLMILLSLVAGPLVPGPGGIPLFLIGFALILFPGKRRLTARVLRGKPVRFRAAPFALISLGVALGMVTLALPLMRSRSEWMAAHHQEGPLALAAVYVVVAATIFLIARLAPRPEPPAAGRRGGRHKFRPWLRQHHIRLLPPRRRKRLGHETGIGPLPVSDEILKFLRRRKHPS